MSTAAAAEKPEGSGFIAWLAHHEWVVYLALGVELLAYTVNGIRQLIGAPASLVWSIFLFTCLAIGLTGSMLTFSTSKHFERLCEGCIAAMPLNGPELAEKRAWALTVHHFPAVLRERVQRLLGGRFHLAVAVVMAMQFAVFMVFFLLVGWLLHAPSLAVALLIVGSIFLGVVGMWHRPLIPWCKWCNSGRGRGPRERVCTPPPLPTISPEPVKIG